MRSVAEAGSRGSRPPPALPGAGDNAARYYEMQYASDVPLEEELEAIMAQGEIHAEQDEKIKKAFASADADSSG